MEVVTRTKNAVISKKDVTTALKCAKYVAVVLTVKVINLVPGPKIDERNSRPPSYLCVDMQEQYEDEIEHLGKVREDYVVGAVADTINTK